MSGAESYRITKYEMNAPSYVKLRAAKPEKNTLDRQEYIYIVRRYVGSKSNSDCSPK